MTGADGNVRNQNRNLALKYNLPLSLVENLRDVFKKFDDDDDGTVSGKEILDVFRTFGAIFTRQQCDEVIKCFLGGNIYGEIDFEEMIAMFSHRKSNAKEYQQDLELAFRMFDVDGDGYICAEDLKQVMKMLGNDLSDEEIRSIYSHLDTDDNGLIDFAEFESILYPNTTRQSPIVKKKQHKKHPHSPKHQSKLPGQRKLRPGQAAVSGFNTIKVAGGNASGIYNTFYSEHEDQKFSRKQSMASKNSFLRENRRSRQSSRSTERRTQNTKGRANLKRSQ